MDAVEQRVSASEPRPSRRDRPAHMQIKTYVVLRRVFSSNPDKPNVEVLDVKLSLAAAEEIRDQFSGTWIERIYADKQPVLSDKASRSFPKARRKRSN